jgi:two-component system, sensor histidine kinase LadS
MFKFIVVFVLGIAFSFIIHAHPSAASELGLTGQTTVYQLAETMEVLADPDNKYTIADIQGDTATDFLSSNGTTSYGYSADVYWVRFKLTNETEHADWVVELSNPFFDRVSFFSPQADGSYAESVASHNQPAYLREIDHRFFAFKAHIQSGESRIFYMRVESNSYEMVLPVTLWEEKRFASKTRQEWLLIGGYYGIIIVMMLHNLFLYFSLRLKGYLYYVAYVMVFAVAQSFWLGDGFQYFRLLLPYLPDSIMSVLSNLCFFLGFLFIFDVLRPKQYSIVLHRILQVCTVATLLVFALSLLLNADSAAAQMLIFHPFAMFPVVLFTSIYCWIKGSQQAKYMLFGWVVLMLGSSATILMSFGFLPQGFLTKYGMPLGSAIEAVLFSFALANRIQIIRQQYDLTQLQLFETQTRFAEELQQTVEERTAELQGSNEQLMLTEQERQRLLSNVSHDLRTPLTLVQGILETLSGNLIQDKPTIQKYSSIAYNRVLGINRLIDDLTELSHLEVKRIPFDFRLVSIGELEDLLSSYQYETEVAGLSFEVFAEITARRKVIMIDLDRIKQVFDNLLSNSIKHTPPGGEITLALDSKEDWVLITLSNTGAKIAEEDLPHIFDRFYQGNHEQAGMGLGLSIVKEIVSQHHGQISVSSLQKGTAFTIQLPLSDENQS